MLGDMKEGDIIVRWHRNERDDCVFWRVITQAGELTFQELGRDRSRDVIFSRACEAARGHTGWFLDAAEHTHTQLDCVQVPKRRQRARSER